MEVKFKKVKGLLAKAPTPAAGQTLSKEVSLPDPSQPCRLQNYQEKLHIKDNFFEDLNR